MTLATPHAARTFAPTVSDLDPEYLKLEALRRVQLADQCLDAIGHGDPFLWQGVNLVSGNAVRFAETMVSTAQVYATMAATAEGDRSRRSSSASALALFVALVALLCVALVLVVPG